MTTLCKEHFYHCPHCGNTIKVIGTKEMPLQCCDEDMDELVCHTADTDAGKHLPVVMRHGDLLTVEIGTTPHPMTFAHSIEWIALETNRGNYCTQLKPQDKPCAVFLLQSAVPQAVYTYCSLHGLWKMPL